MARPRRSEGARRRLPATPNLSRLCLAGLAAAVPAACDLPRPDGSDSVGMGIYRGAGDDPVSPETVQALEDRTRLIQAY